ncbi:hypothetical protein AOLI_G00213350 [Acnodon oligacanthus]
MKPAWASSERGEDGACWTVGVECGGRPLTLNDLANEKETPGTETLERILRGQVCVSSVHGATHSAELLPSPSEAQSILIRSSPHKEATGPVHRLRWRPPGGDDRDGGQRKMAEQI